MEYNWIAIVLAGLVPVVIGFIWYNPALFGNYWHINREDVSQYQMEGTNQILKFGLTFLLGIMAAFMLTHLTVHQTGVHALMMHFPETANPESEMAQWFADFQSRFHGVYRSYGHGALHGLIAGVFLALPIVAINTLFERNSWRYTLVNAGYWIICFTLMGAIVCGWV